MFEFTSEEWVAIALSLKVAFVATVASLPFAIFAAYALARWTFPGRSLLDGLLHLPLVLPPVVTGYMLLLAFGKAGPIGKFLFETFGISFSFRWTGAALACAVMGFPLMLRAIRLSFESIDRRLEFSGRNARCKSSMDVSACHAATRAPGRPRWCHHVFCQGTRRIWCNDHVRFQYSGRNADDLSCDLHVYAGSWWGHWSHASDPRLDRHRIGCFGRVGIPQPSCAAAHRCLRVEIKDD